MWEIIERNSSEETKRLKVHNGWLVINRYKPLQQTFAQENWIQCMHYFKDPGFEWEI